MQELDPTADLDEIRRSFRAMASRVDWRDRYSKSAFPAVGLVGDAPIDDREVDRARSLPRRRDPDIERGR